MHYGYFRPAPTLKYLLSRSFSKDKNKLEKNLEWVKACRKATRQPITDSVLVNMYNMFAQWSFYILLTLVSYFTNTVSLVDI